MSRIVFLMTVVIVTLTYHGVMALEGLWWTICVKDTVTFSPMTVIGGVSTASCTFVLFFLVEDSRLSMMFTANSGMRVGVKRLDGSG